MKGENESPLLKMGVKGGTLVYWINLNLVTQSLKISHLLEKLLFWEGFVRHSVAKIAVCPVSSCVTLTGRHSVKGVIYKYTMYINMNGVILLVI